MATGRSAVPAVTTTTAPGRGPAGRKVTVWVGPVPDTSPVP